MERSQLRQRYIPEELNAVFWKAAKHIIGAVKIYTGEPHDLPKGIDVGMLESQINIIHEKFAHDLLKTLADTRARFLGLPTINRNVQIDGDSALSFVVPFYLATL